MVARALLGLLALLAAGNAAILAATQWCRRRVPGPAPDVRGIANLRTVDERVVRGAAPGEVALRDLAARGVTTVVDLRAEADIRIDEQLLAELGMVRHHLPVRDGRVPTAEQVRSFLDIVATSPGGVLLHCGAGVGRTGAMAAAYVRSSGQVTGLQALCANLAVGPPSLEQIVFAARAGAGVHHRPGRVVTALSRFLDGPRRLWHHMAEAS